MIFSDERLPDDTLLKPTGKRGDDARDQSEQLPEKFHQNLFPGPDLSPIPGNYLPGGS